MGRSTTTIGHIMKPGARILVVDDELWIRRSLQVHLEGKGYVVLTARSGEQAIEKFSQHVPDVVIADLILPGMDGIELTRNIREASTVPIIVLSAIGEDQKKVEALELGADDYVTKPFNLDELVARIRALFRRSTKTPGHEPVVKKGNLYINFERREVKVNGELVKLTPKEYELLKCLSQNEGKVLTHGMLLTAVWGQAHGEAAKYLRVFVSQLRKKLGEDPAQPQYIKTEPGVGYRFSSDIGENEGAQ